MTSLDILDFLCIPEANPSGLEAVINGILDMALVPGDVPLDTSISLLGMSNGGCIPLMLTKFSYIFQGNPSLEVSRTCWSFKHNTLSSLVTLYANYHPT